MAATATQRALLIDGEWVETGDWLEVRSPYSGDVVARVHRLDEMRHIEQWRRQCAWLGDQPQPQLLR